MLSDLHVTDQSHQHMVMGNWDSSLCCPGTTTHSKVEAFCVHIEFELGEMLKIYKQELVLWRR